MVAGGEGRQRRPECRLEIRHIAAPARSSLAMMKITEA
jgi:hypothetical protein